MEQSRIDRINELAHLAKTRALTAEEQAERQILRREYLDSITGSLSAQLDHTYFVETDGSQTKLKKKDGQ
jgi:Uncharacterized protein conserved in bacteria